MRRHPLQGSAAVGLAIATIAAAGFTSSAHASGGIHIVHAGQSIQSAVDAARPGDRVIVGPGTYAQQVTISTDGITLVGLHAVLEPPATPTNNTCSGLAGPGTEAGICVTGRQVELAPFVVEHRKVLSVGRRVERVSIIGLEVHGFTGPDIAIVGAGDARVTGNRAIDGAQYGVLTAGSTGTTITANVVGSSGPLPFIGICMDDVAPVVVAYNQISGYDVGLCIQTQGADVHDNRVRSTCIGAFIDPGVHARVHDNRISSTNPRCPDDNLYGMFGILVAGSVGSEVSRNRIEGQTGEFEGQPAPTQAVGLAVVDFDATNLASNNLVTRNVLVDNDLDLLVTATGAGNVVTGNRCTTSSPPGLCM
jgi:hypothetical protein